ncbi:MAG: CapK related-protein [Parcubacteria group bacterium GW2011_GWB1_43_6]|nr:MAG: CapK related-protein [Parcubacteria group bacterium GW2011_GWB1_43_6]
MNENEKFERLVNPDNFFPRDLRRGALCGNKNFINATETYLKILAESQFWPRERLEGIQVKRLRTLTARIAARSLFWAKLFREHKFSPATATLRDLTRLPIFRRKDILGFGESIYISPKDEDYPLFTRMGSGTTGIPLKLIFSEREFLIGWIPFLLRHPVFEQQSLVKLLSRKPFVVLGRPGMRYAFEKDFFFRTFDTIQSSDLEQPDVRKEIYKSIHEATPAILMGFGSLVAKLAQLALEERADFPLLAVRISSESVSSTERELINRVFKAPVINLLSGNGIGTLGYECLENPNRFHLHSESVALEVAGENGVIMPSGEEGELVATSFAFTLTPIVHFAHEDMGQLIPGMCPCGRTLPLFEFTGRRDYDVVLPSGKKIRMIHFHNILMEHGLGYKSRQMQIIQNALDNLRILVVPRKRLNDQEEINMRLALTSLFEGEKINIEIEYVESISLGNGNKPRLFVPLSESK